VEQRGKPVILSLYFVFPLLLLVALVEVTILPHLQVAGAQPDLMMLVVGAWSLRRGLEEGAIWAFFGGLFLDLLSAGPMSASMFALLAVSLILGVDPLTGAGRRQARPFGGNPFALIVVIIFATLCYHILLLILLQLVGSPIDWLRAATDVLLPRVVFNLVLIPVVYRALGALDRRVRGEEIAI
jgi:rod shape-determining protein MreD